MKLKRANSFLHKKFRKFQDRSRYSILWVLHHQVIILEFNKDHIPIRIDTWTPKSEHIEHNEIPDSWFLLAKESKYAPLKTVVQCSDMWLITCKPFQEPYELLKIDYNRLISIALKDNLWFYFMVEKSWEHFKQTGAVITHIAESLFQLCTTNPDTLVSFKEKHFLWMAFFAPRKNFFFFNRFDVEDAKAWLFWHLHVAKLLNLKYRFLPLNVPDDWTKELKQYGEIIRIPAPIKRNNYEPNLPVERYVLMLNFK